MKDGQHLAMTHPVAKTIMATLTGLAMVSPSFAIVNCYLFSAFLFRSNQKSSPQ